VSQGAKIKGATTFHKLAERPTRRPGDMTRWHPWRFGGSRASGENHRTSFGAFRRNSGLRQEKIFCQRVFKPNFYVLLVEATKIL
jgi:hypothetical protein